MSQDIHSLEGHTLTFGNYQLTGFVDGEAFAIEEAGESVTAHQGTHKLVCFAKKPNNITNVTVRFFKTSNANKVMAKLYADQQAGLEGPLPLGIRDNLGDLKVNSEKVMISKRAAIPIATEPGQREWALLAANAKVDEGLLTA